MMWVKARTRGRCAKETQISASKLMPNDSKQMTELTKGLKKMLVNIHIYTHIHIYMYIYIFLE